MQALPIQEEKMMDKNTCSKCDGKGKFLFQNDVREICPYCHGTGDHDIDGKEECSHCDGSGKVRGEK